jgi:hypothetical protein
LKQDFHKQPVVNARAGVLATNILGEFRNDIEGRLRQTLSPGYEWLKSEPSRVELPHCRRQSAIKSLYVKLNNQGSGIFLCGQACMRCCRRIFAAMDILL